VKLCKSNKQINRRVSLPVSHFSDEVVCGGYVKVDSVEVDIIDVGWVDVGSGDVLVVIVDGIISELVVDRGDGATGSCDVGLFESRNLKCCVVGLHVDPSWHSSIINFTSHFGNTPVLPVGQTS